MRKRTVPIALVAAIVLVSLGTAAGAQIFQPLGHLPTRNGSSAEDVSADGSVVVGSAFERAFRWTEAGGMEPLDSLDDISHGVPFMWDGRGVSGDGTVVAGRSLTMVADDLSSRWDGARWSAAGGTTALTGDPMLGGDAYDVSADGNRIVGFLDQGAAGGEAFLHSAAGLVPLGDLPGGDFHSIARAISADGSTVVGTGESASGSEAFRWSESGGVGQMQGLGSLPGGNFWSSAKDVSWDGSVIVGTSGSEDGGEAYRWTEAGGMVGLGDLPGGDFRSSASGVSGDGSIVVGTGATDSHDRDAFVWDDVNGMQSLQDLLRRYVRTEDWGDAWHLRTAGAISQDGSTIVGTMELRGEEQAYRVSLDALFLNDVPHSLLFPLSDLDLGAGDELAGAGEVTGRVTGAPGSTIRAALGQLHLGDPSIPDGFSTFGLLETGPYGVFLRNEDSGDAILGGTTRVEEDGWITAQDGARNLGSFYLEGGTFYGFLHNDASMWGRGKVLALDNFGTVWTTGTLAALTLNRGTVNIGGDTFEPIGGFTNHAGGVVVLDGGHLADDVYASEVDNQAGGIIRGSGRVANLANSGLLHAEGSGLINLTDFMGNQAGGEIRIDEDSAVFSLGGFVNQGEVVLRGTNARMIATGTLENPGTIRGSGIVDAPVENHGWIHAQDGPLEFLRSVTNHEAGIIKNTDGELIFAAGLTNLGAYASDPADNFFTELIVGDTGYLIGGLGDRFIISGDFHNLSQRGDVWDTSEAELIFRAGNDDEHVLQLPSADQGPISAGLMASFAWSVLSLESGQSILLGDGNNDPGAALYVDTLLLADGLNQVDLLLSNGFNVYYNPLAPGNAYLAGEAIALPGGGLLAPIPEPTTALLVAAGLVGIAWARRRR